MKRNFTPLLNRIVTGKKYTINAVKFFLFTILLCGISNVAFAAITVTPATGGTNICSNLAVNGSAPAFTTLGDIVLTEGLANDFGNVTGTWNVNIAISPPVGWVYNGAIPPTISFTPSANITGITTTTYNANTLLIRVSGSGDALLDAITISGLQIQASSVTSASGNLGITSFGGTATGIGGFPGVNGGNLSLSPLPITGATGVCVGSIITLTDPTTAGAWTSSNTLTATVAAGAVTGVAAGVVNIDYTVAGCITSHSLTVSAPPGTFGGVMTVCVGSTTTLSNSVSGGAWSTLPLTIATVTGGTGIVSGVGAGTAIITYTSGACPTATVAVVVNARASIGGPATLCIGGNITLSTSIAGGTWSSATSSVATIGSTSGTVSAGSAGTTVISYVTLTGCTRTTNIIVNAPPAAIINGITSVCTGGNTTLSNAVTGGTWTSGTPGVATITMSGGVVSGVLAGTTVVSYSITACPSATVTVTVNTTPIAIVGPNVVCQNSTIILSDGVSGGVWSSSNTTRATVVGSAAGGTVTGVGVGAVNISYTNGTCTVIRAITVNAIPAVITGNIVLCTGTTTNLSDITGAGTWSSSNSSVAIVVSGSGVVFGTTAGTTVIAYTLATGCQRTTNVTVNQSPNPINGNLNICLGLVVPLSDATPGGTWTSSTSSVATIDVSNGNVTGVTVGNSTITYTEPAAGCIAITMVNVITTPSGILGPNVVCEGAMVTLSNTTSGGTWSSDNSAVATIDVNTGDLFGVTAGTANITYDFGSTCFATGSITVNPLPVAGAITGVSSICLGATTSLTDPAAGGVWTSSNTSVATVSATGFVSSVSAGAATIFYTVTNSCGTVFASNPMTVDNFIPDVTISPSANPSCFGAPVTFTATPINGGTAPTYQWKVNGVISSVLNPFTYTPLNGDIIICRVTSNATCLASPTGFDTLVMVVDPNQVPAVSIASDIYGDTVCVGTLTQFTATPVNGGATPTYQWYVAGFPTAITNPMSYVPANGDIVAVQLTSSYHCAVPATVISNSVTMTVDVSEAPTVTITASENPSCKGSPVTYTAHTLYGGIAPFIRWTQDGINVATGPTYTIIPQDNDQFYCTLKSSQTCRTVDSVFSNIIVEFVDSPIVPVVNVVSKLNVMNVGQYDTLIAVVTPVAIITPTFQWYVNGVAIPGATGSFYVAHPTTGGTMYYYCIVGNGNACHTTTISNMVTVVVSGVGVNPVASGDYDLKLVPNPNTGIFTIEGSISADNQDVTLEIMNTVGQVVYKTTTPVQNEKLNKQINMSGDLANGVYLLHIMTNNAHKVIRFTLSR